MAITIDDVKALMPFARVGFTYTCEYKMLVNGKDGTNSRVVYPKGVSKVADYVIGCGTELRYTEMVRTAALAQNVSERSLAESFIGKPLKGYEWLDGYRGALMYSPSSDTIQLRGYAIDDDGKIPGRNARYVDNATGETLDFERDLKRYQSDSPSANKARGVQYLVIDGVELRSVDGTRIFKPAPKNFKLSGITDLVIEP